jgi:hypothetical protein
MSTLARSSAALIRPIAWQSRRVVSAAAVAMLADWACSLPVVLSGVALTFVHAADQQAESER